MNKTDFAGLLCSRLCHDLVSPVGAINNGIELLTDKNNADMQEQIVELIQDSARQTTNKLQFFRLAFGLGGSFGATISVDEARRALSGLFDPAKVAISWDCSVLSLPKESMKILLNLALVAGETIIGVGALALSLSATDEGLTSATITASGSRVSLQETQRSVLASGGDPESVDPKSIPLVMAQLIASDQEFNISLDETKDGQISFILSK